LSKKIALFNHKGGVSKTTTTFHLGWKLASMGKRVLLIDADPQCNLSGLVIGNGNSERFDTYYQNNPNSNFKDALDPAFESRPEPIAAIEPYAIESCENLFLIPGHINLSEIEVTLGIAQELSSSIQALKNLPGSISYFIDKQVESSDIDFVLFDMNPSLGALNQNLLMISDYFILPSAPDYFSKMAVQSLINILPRWKDWSERAQHLPILQSAAYPFPSGFPKFIGTILQKYRPRSGAPTMGFQSWIDQINQLVSEEFVPKLKEINMACSVREYRNIDPNYEQTYCLAQIPDFNTLIAKSQEFNTPVFALTDGMFNHSGAVLEQEKIKRQEFDDIYSNMVSDILNLIDE